MTDQLDLTACLASRADVRREVAALWRREIAVQPMTLACDDGTKTLALAELSIRVLEEAGWSRSVHAAQQAVAHPTVPDTAASHRMGSATRKRIGR
ncbi:hypothetical protein [Nocardia asiatica]|uniref:hypothetical protein n=1 Tax=Nocardia asiatica TaxID=209252 RepID=UPI00030C9307|nr:hypothetical protein [Nocardia asiatica]